MPAYRFYTQQELKPQKTITVDKEEHKHLRQVMRIDVGDSLEVTDGKGHLGQAKVTSFEKHSSVIEIESVDFFKQEISFDIYQAVPKISKLDALVEKATELGMGTMYLFMGDKSTQKFQEEKLKRLEKIAISSLKQSGRLYLPKFKVISPIAQWKEGFTGAYFGDLSKEAEPLVKALPKERKPVSFCNGPEAGFSSQEIEKLKQLGFQGVSLHHNILRTETAPLAFLSIAFNSFSSQGDGPIVN